MHKSESYRSLWAAARRRDNYPSVFTATLERLAGDLDLSSVRSCVGIGTGNGQYELQFVRRMLPSLVAFTAVEPDTDSVAELRATIQNGKAPSGVITEVVQAKAEDWKGVDQPVDAVLLFHMLYNYPPAARRALFRRLISDCLVPGGILLVITNDKTTQPGNAALLFERLSCKLQPWEEIEVDILAAGFRQELAYDLQGSRDFTDPDEDFLKFYQMLAGRPVSLDEVRATMAELFPQGMCDQYLFKLAVYRK